MFIYHITFNITGGDVVQHRLAAFSFGPVRMEMFLDGVRRGENTPHRPCGVEVCKFARFPRRKMMGAIFPMSHGIPRLFGGWTVRILDARFSQYESSYNQFLSAVRILYYMHLGLHTHIYSVCLYIM